jgi:hypothetical protein
MRSEKRTQDLEARFGAKSGETVGSAGDEERIGPSHISILVEIQNYSKSVSNTWWKSSIKGLEQEAVRVEKRWKFMRFSLLTGVWGAWDNF